MIFTGIAAAIGAVATFIGGLGAIGTFALQMAASIGLSYLAKAIAGKKSGAATPETMGVQGTLQSGGDVPRSFIMGKGATAGSLVYANTWGTSGGTPNAYLTQVIALSDLPVKGLFEVWVNNEKVTLTTAAPSGGTTIDIIKEAWSAAIAAGLSPLFNPAGEAFVANYILEHTGQTIGTGGVTDYGYPVLEYRKDGKDHLWVKFYDGTQTTADAFLTSKVGSTDRPYESTRVGTGVAYVIVTSLVEDTLFTGFPQFIWGVDGIRLYDPSKDDTVGGTGDQRYSDPATWGDDGDYLTAVQTYNLLRGISYGGQWLYGLQGVTSARLPASNWIAQIEKCRAPVDIGDDETEPAYRSGGQIDVSVQLGDTVEALLTACQGKLAETGGFYKIHLGAPDSPTFFFTDDDIISTSEQSFTPFFGLSDTITGVAAKYPEPAEAWAMKPAPPLYRTDLDAKAGNRRLMADVSLDFVPYSAQAQRLMQSALLAAQRARRHTHTFPPSYWYVEPGDVGAWTSVRNGYTEKLFEVNGAVDKANLDITVDLTEVDPADFAWDFTTDFTPVTTGPTVFPRPSAQPVIDWYVEPFIIRDELNRPRRPAIRMTWDGSMPDVDGVQYEVRLASDASPVTRGRTDQLAAASIIVSQSLLPNTAYEARGQYLPSSPRDVLWSDWLPVTTPDVKFSVLDFDNSLSDLVTTSFSDATSAIDKIVQVVGNAVLDALGKSNADKQILRSEIYAQAGSLSASVEQVQQAVATNEEAFGQFQTTVTAAIEENSASVQENATAIATVDGKLVGSYGVTLTVDGYASGFQSLNDGSTSTFAISADVFRVAFPGVTGGSPVPVFQIANVGGVPKVVFRGDMYGDGTVTASKIDVGELSAIAVSAGTLTGGKLQNAAGTVVFDLDAGDFTVWGS